MSGRLPTQITNVKPSGEGDRVRFVGQIDPSSVWICEGPPTNARRALTSCDLEADLTTLSKTNRIRERDILAFILESRGIRHRWDCFLTVESASEGKAQTCKTTDDCHHGAAPPRVRCLRRRAPGGSLVVHPRPRTEDYSGKDFIELLLSSNV
jgi:hypothetical protein